MKLDTDIPNRKSKPLSSPRTPFDYSDNNQKDFIMPLKRSPPKAFDLKNEDTFEKLFKWLQVFLKISPAFLGLTDGITDIFYYITQNFADRSIKDINLATLLFTPLALAMIWDLEFSNKNYLKRDKTNYNKRLQSYYAYQNELAKLLRMGQKSRSLQVKVQLYLVWIYFLNALTYLIFMIQNSFMSLIYAVLQEIRLLPFIIGFKDPTLKKIQFPITKPLVAEFQARQHLFIQENDIKLKNDKITNENLYSSRFNEKEMLNQSDVRKHIKQLLPLPQIYCTHPQKAAQIMNSLKSWDNTLLTDPYVSNFLDTTSLIKAVFQSLPMLIIQYINNSQLQIWGSTFNKLSFILSAVNVAMSCIQMIYHISKSETFPLLEFKSYIKKKSLYENPLWLLKGNTDEEFLIYDIETLRIAAFANRDFFTSIKGIRFDISSDPEFILRCLEGPYFSFECLSNIILNMDQQNEFNIQISHNKEIDVEHIEILFNALQNSDIRKIMVEANQLKHEQKVGYPSLEKLITDFVSTSQCSNIKLEFNHNKLQFEYPMYFGRTLSDLQMSFEKNKIKSLEFLGDLQNCRELINLNLNLGHNSFSETKDIMPLFSLPIIKHININLSYNNLSLDRIKFAEFSTIESLTLNLDKGTQENLSFLEASTSLQKLRYLNLTILDQVENFDGLQSFKQCLLLQDLKLELGAKIQNIRFISCLNNLNKIRSLHLDFKYNKIIKINQLEELHYLRSLKTLYLNFSDNSILTLESLKMIKNLTSLQNCHIGISNNKIDQIDVFSCFLENQELISLSLELQKNQIKNIEPIAGIKNLYQLQTLRLDLSQNLISNVNQLAVIKELTGLKTIDLKFNDNTIDILQAFKDTKELTTLRIEFRYLDFDINTYISGNKISSIISLHCLQDFIQLQTLHLDLRGNKIDNINQLTAIENLTQLRTVYLNFNNNSLESIEVFQCFSQTLELVNLCLELENNKITNIDSLSVIKDLTKMKYLTLNFKNNLIRNIEGLNAFGTLKNLQEFQLILSDVELEDVRPIAFIQNLQQIEMFDFWFGSKHFENKNDFLQNYQRLMNASGRRQFLRKQPEKITQPI